MYCACEVFPMRCILDRIANHVISVRLVVETITALFQSPWSNHEFLTFSRHRCFAGWIKLIRNSRDMILSDGSRGLCSIGYPLETQLRLKFILNPNVTNSHLLKPYFRIAQLFLKYCPEHGSTPANTHRRVGLCRTDYHNFPTALPPSAPAFLDLKSIPHQRKHIKMPYKQIGAWILGAGTCDRHLYRRKSHVLVN